MKKNSSVICLSFLIIFLLVTPIIGSSDWVILGNDSDGNVFSYKKGNVEKGKSKYVVQVWEKNVYSDTGRKKYIQESRKKGVSIEGYDKLSESKSLFEIDCKKHRIRILSYCQNDIDGKVLDSQSSDKREWTYIIPDSHGESLYEQVCK